MDLDDGSELSDVDETFIDEYETEAAHARTIALEKANLKQQEFGLRSTGMTYNEDEEADDNGGSEDGGNPDSEVEEELVNEDENDGQSRRYEKKKHRSRDGLRLRGEVSISAASTPLDEPTLETGYQPEDRNRIKFTKKNHWSNPGTPAYDVKRMLMSDECLAPDNLSRRPTADFSYFTPDGDLRPAPRYEWHPPGRITHPKYAAYLKTWNLTKDEDKSFYWNFTLRDHNYPFAGQPRESSEVRDLELTFASFIKNDLTDAHSQEEAFNARPSIHLPIPDHIKAILVDDWENVTKNQQLVPLPATHTVDSILNDYMVFENPKRQAGTNQAELLQEVVMGLKEYFEKCLGRILLYR
jgi:hypothetical protein